MPNWCFNRLEISLHNESGKKLLDAFRDNHTGEDGKKFPKPFNDLLPTPQELMDTEASFGNQDPELVAKREANKAKYGHEHWYDWRLANWGCKWDACEVQIQHEDEHVASVYFETPWCPATELFAWFSEQNPDVVFCNEYDEEGMGFAGYDKNSAWGFASESWEPKSAPSLCDLMDEIPEGEALGQK